MQLLTTYKIPDCEEIDLSHVCEVKKPKCNFFNRSKWYFEVIMNGKNRKFFGTEQDMNDYSHDLYCSWQVYLDKVVRNIDFIPNEKSFVNAGLKYGIGGKKPFYVVSIKNQSKELLVTGWFFEPDSTIPPYDTKLKILDQSYFFEELSKGALQSIKSKLYDVKSNNPNPNIKTQMDDLIASIP